MPRLTKQIVDAAKPRERAYFAWCSDLPGFGLRTHPTGRKAYYADYRNAAGVRKRIKLGAHPKITCEEARKLALQTLGDATKGEDPASERATGRSAITVKQLCDDYLSAADKGLIFGKRGQPRALHGRAGPRSHRPAHCPAAWPQACPRADPSRRRPVHPRRDGRQDGDRREDEGARQGRRHRGR